MKKKYGREIVAHCYANGVIRFRSVRRPTPKGAIDIVKGPGKVIRSQISAVARHAYDGKTLLVPGVPESASQHDAMNALIKWRKWCLPGINEKIAAAKAGTLDLFRIRA